MSFFFLSFFFLDVDHFLKSLFVTILFLFHVFVFWLRGMWDLSSQTKDLTGSPCIGRRSLNHLDRREVPRHVFVFMRSILPEFCFVFFCHLKQINEMNENKTKLRIVEIVQARDKVGDVSGGGLQTFQ